MRSLTKLEKGLIFLIGALTLFELLFWLGVFSIVGYVGAKLWKQSY